MSRDLILTEETHNFNIVEGKFNIVASHYQSGKTTVLANIAAKAVKDEKNIIYYGLDSSDEYMRKRIYAVLENKPLNDIKAGVITGIYDIPDPINIVFNSKGLDDMTLGFDVELLGNVEFLFIDTINLFTILGPTFKGFEDRLQAQIEFFNSLCAKRNITIIASLNILKVHTFDLERWKEAVSGNVLVADNQYVNFKIFDSKGNKTRDYGLINSSMRITCEIEDRTTDKKLKSLFIPSTGYTPEIKFDVGTKTFLIKGRTYPSHADQFWKPIYEWFKEYCDTNPQNLTLDISLDFISSGSEKYVLDIIKLLKKCTLPKVRWYYDNDDEDIMDLGEDLFKSTGVSFLFVQNKYAGAEIFD
jgi:energy-coupling factor transporter ATP-binding protein EcfA2